MEKTRTGPWFDIPNMRFTQHAHSDEVKLEYIVANGVENHAMKREMSKTHVDVSSQVTRLDNGIRKNVDKSCGKA